MFKRELKIGDQIMSQGVQATIASITFQDFYNDEHAHAKEQDDSYINIEFHDAVGNHRYWKSNVDGGRIFYKD